MFKIQTGNNLGLVGVLTLDESFEEENDIRFIFVEGKDISSEDAFELLSKKKLEKYMEVSLSFTDSNMSVNFNRYLSVSERSELLAMLNILLIPLLHSEKLSSDDICDNIVYKQGTMNNETYLKAKKFINKLNIGFKTQSEYEMDEEYNQNLKQYRLGNFEEHHFYN